MVRRKGLRYLDSAVGHISNRGAKRGRQRPQESLQVPNVSSDSACSRGAIEYDEELYGCVLPFERRPRNDIGAVSVLSHPYILLLNIRGRLVLMLRLHGDNHLSSAAIIRISGCSREWCRGKCDRCGERRAP